MESLVKIEDLVKYFPIRGGLFGKTTAKVSAVDNVSFEILKGETFGLVGESGCGKTTIGKLVLRLIEPTSGSIFFRDSDISHLSGKKLKELRRRMQIVFQDPFSSLNPRMTVRQTINRAITIHRIVKRGDKEERILELLERVGVGAQPPSPEWGAIIITGRDFIMKEWWIATFPGIALLFAVMGFNLFGDGLRDALDPRLRR